MTHNHLSNLSEKITFIRTLIVFIVSFVTKTDTHNFTYNRYLPNFEHQIKQNFESHLEKSGVK